MSQPHAQIQQREGVDVITIFAPVQPPRKKEKGKYTIVGQTRGWRDALVEIIPGKEIQVMALVGFKDDQKEPPAEAKLIDAELVKVDDKNYFAIHIPVTKPTRKDGGTMYLVGSTRGFRFTNMKLPSGQRLKVNALAGYKD